MIEETYAVFASWDFSLSKRENLKRLRDTNYIGARSQTWLRDVAKVLNRRSDPERDRSLIALAKAGCDIEVWKPLFLWRITRDEFLLRDFLCNWLFPAYEVGALRPRSAEVVEYLHSIKSRGAITEHSWTQATMERVAAGLLRIAADFGLLRGSGVKEFAPYHLPEQSFVYLLHAMRDDHVSPPNLISVPDWRMYLMRPADVEHELLRLHQFKKLDYQVAGSLVQISLPCENSYEYAQRMVA